MESSVSFKRIFRAQFFKQQLQLAAITHVVHFPTFTIYGKINILTWFVAATFL